MSSQHGFNRKTSDERVPKMLLPVNQAEESDIIAVDKARCKEGGTWFFMACIQRKKATEEPKNRPAL